MGRTSSTKHKPRSRRNAAKGSADGTAGKLPVPRELLSAGVLLDAELELERQRRLEKLKSLLIREFEQGRGLQAIDRVMASVQELERENERLAWRVLQANRYRFGRRTEKLSPEQLQQLFFAFGGDAAEADRTEELAVPTPAQPEQGDGEGAAASEPLSQGPSGQPAGKPPKKRQRVQSMTVGAQVERNVTLVPVADQERTCALCGRGKKTIGHVDHECIKFVPAKIVVEVERREKVACIHCRKDVSVAPRQRTPAIVRRVDASLLANLVAEKCALALPLDRQRRKLGRLGLNVPDKTLQSYWAYATDLLEPIAVSLLSFVFGQSLVGADDSHLRTLSQANRRGVFRGHLWCFVGTDGTVGGPETVAYGYTPSWEAAEITDWFSQIDGFIQCDGYAGYSRPVKDEDGGQTIVAVPPERRLGCGMHIRSKFHAALLARDRRAATALKHFADLYQIEADCKRQALDAVARGEERRRRSLPILDALDDWVDQLHPKLLPKSPLRRATTYAINQRPFFRRCFTDGRFEIDNGRVERRIRLFAMAKRAFLFTGSPRGGERLAIAFTLVDNCLALNLDPYPYLVQSIQRLEAGWPLRRLNELTPQRWALEQSPQHCPE